MEGTNLQELKKKKMKPTGSESCGLVEGLAIQEVKSLRFDEKMLEIIISSPKLKVSNRRN